MDLWYRYYAGYSAGFVEQALQESAATAKLVLDPWNGTGTTTVVAASKNVPAIGFDVNPALVVVSRARLLERRQAIAAEITRTEHSTERYFEAFEQGRLSPERCEQRVARLSARLDDLRAQQAELADDGTDEPCTRPQRPTWQRSPTRSRTSSQKASPSRPRRSYVC